MKELSERDMKILTKRFLETLNELVNEDEDKCVESAKIFEATGLKGFDPVVVPAVVQELRHQGLINECEIEGQVRITRKGKNRLHRTIDSNVDLVLKTLATHSTDDLGRVVVQGARLQELTDLTPIEINDAVGLLEEAGFVTTHKALGTYPFTFFHVELTPRGKYEYVRQFREASLRAGEDRRGYEERRVTLPPTPAGSPFGFTDTHWEIVIERKRTQNKLFVVFGYKFESIYYDTQKLVINIRKMFENAVRDYRINNPDSPNIEIGFKTLSAGYGQHLFNEIASDIISADIAVFDASDLNANVMIEIGVALTWGVRILPIREKTAPTLPSDISGQVWAEYSNNGLDFLPGHAERLLSMVEFAIRKKRGSY